MKLKRYLLLASIFVITLFTILSCAKKGTNNPEPLGKILRQSFSLIFSEYVEPVSTKELFAYGCEAINEYFKIKSRREKSVASSDKKGESKKEEEQPVEEKIPDTVVCSETHDGSVNVKIKNEAEFNLTSANFSSPEATADALWTVISRALATERDFKAAFYDVVNILVMKLDPHSGFLSPKDYAELMSDTHGHFSGVGIEIGMQNEKITVIAPIEGTPAWKAGIKTGDVISKIDDISTEGMSLLEAVSKIRGPEGTRVKLTISRPAVDNPLEFTITRATIHVLSVKSIFIEPHTAYLRLITFHQTTDEEFNEAVQILFQRYNGKVKAIILDLRSNPGGLLDQAVNVADMFIKSGALVSTRTRNESKNFLAKDDKSALETLPLIVLISPGSASASEIVSGAIKDANRGLLMGMRTFGKGSVQSILTIDDSALRLTTALYYTPSGRSIQAVGIEPHIEFTFLTKEGEIFEPFGEEKLEGHLKPNSMPEKPLLVFSGDLIAELYKKKGLISDELDPQHPERTDFMVRLAARILEEPNRDVNKLLERAKAILQSDSDEAKRLNVQIKPLEKKFENPEDKKLKEER